MPQNETVTTKRSDTGPQINKKQGQPKKATPRKPRSKIPAFSVIVGCIAILYYIVVTLEGDVTSVFTDTKRRRHQSSSTASFPCTQWDTLLSLAELDKVQNGQEVGTQHTQIRTERLPHLGEMLAFRQNPNIPSGSKLVFQTRTDSRFVLASTLSAATEELSKHLSAFEDNGLEDADVIKRYTWSVDGSSIEEPSQRTLPMDVMLLGEFVSALSKELRTALLDTPVNNDVNRRENTGQLPALTLDQQLVTLCHVEANVLPKYFLLIEETVEHLNSLMNAVECVRILRDEMIGTVIPTAKNIAKKNKGSLFGKSGLSAQSQATKETEDQKSHDDHSKILKSHQALEAELNQLLLVKEVTRETILKTVNTFAEGHLCHANFTTAPGSAVTPLLNNTICLARFASLALPAGLDAKIASLMEEAIVVDPQCVPFRVQYLAHITLGMGRCGVDSIEAIGKELKAQRVRVASTPLFRQWLVALKDVCQRQKDNRADDDFDLTGDQQTIDLTQTFPQQPDTAIAHHWRSRGLEPRPLLADREYKRFIGMARAMAT